MLFAEAASESGVRGLRLGRVHSMLLFLDCMEMPPDLSVPNPHLSDHRNSSCWLDSSMRTCVKSTAEVLRTLLLPFLSCVLKVLVTVS